jgi:uncharacterized membrane protein YqjE
MASPASNPSERRRGTVRSSKSLANLTLKVVSEITTLLHTEIKLLRTEVFEKLTLTRLSAALIAAGAFLLLAAAILILQAGVAALVAYGFSWLVAFLIIAVLTLLIGAALVWYGIKSLSAQHLAPSKTIHQLQKDVTIAQGN